MLPVIWVFFSVEHFVLCIGNGGAFCLMETEKQNTKIQAAVMIKISQISFIHSDWLRAAEREKNGSNIYSF